MPSLLLFGGGAPAAPGTVTVTAVDGVAVISPEKRGGTVVELTGTGFDSSMVVEIIQSAVVVGVGYIFDPEFDVTATSAFVGLPVLEPGLVHDIKVTVGANDGTLVSALLPLLHAEESKYHEARRSFSSAWRLGPRLFLNGKIDLGDL